MGTAIALPAGITTVSFSVGEDKMENNRQYSPDEVTAIVANALRRRRDRDAISHDELLETAAELGIPRHEVEEAAKHLATERDMELARGKWKAKERREFRNHLVSYIIVNAFLFIIDHMVSGGVWYYWSVVGWGIGLAFHAYGTYFPDPDEMETGAKKILAAEKFGISDWKKG